MYDAEAARADSHQYPPTYLASVLVHEAGTDADLHVRHSTSHSRPRPSTVSDEGKEDAVGVELREVMRTPSPTPSEARVLSEKTRICDWKLIYARMRHPRPYMTRRNIWIFVVVVCIIAFFAAFLATQKKIVHALRPFADWMRETPAGWVLPIALMFVLSFPPLFGHEIVAILCGTVYGIWIGFGIVAAGTFLGELGNFYAFRWCCQARGRKFEETRLKYALYAQVVREGGLRVPTIMRFSAIPGHFSTAVFSTCGMSVWMFCASAFLSLPKQLAVVYVGVSEEDSGLGSPGKGNGVKAVVIVITLVMTLIAMEYINRKMDGVKHRVVHARRKARQAKALAALESPVPAIDVDLRPVRSKVSLSASARDQLADGATSNVREGSNASSALPPPAQQQPEIVAISAVPLAAREEGKQRLRGK